MLQVDGALGENHPAPSAAGLTEGQDGGQRELLARDTDKFSSMRVDAETFAKEQPGRVGSDTHLSNGLCGAQSRVWAQQAHGLSVGVVTLLQHVHALGELGSFIDDPAGTNTQLTDMIKPKGPVWKFWPDL